MGVISVLGFVVFLAALIVIRSMIRKSADDFDSDEPERTGLIWAARGCLVVVIVSLVGIVDGYVYKLPNPFGGPKVGNELPQSSPPPPAPSKPDIKADDLRPDMDEVKKEHRDQLKEFEHGPPPAERQDK